MNEPIRSDSAPNIQSIQTEIYRLATNRSGGIDNYLSSLQPIMQDVSLYRSPELIDSLVKATNNNVWMRLQNSETHSMQPIRFSPRDGNLRDTIASDNTGVSVINETNPSDPNLIDSTIIRSSPSGDLVTLETTGPQNTELKRERFCLHFQPADTFDESGISVVHSFEYDALNKNWITEGIDESIFIQAQQALFAITTPINSLRVD